MGGWGGEGEGNSAHIGDAQAHEQPKGLAHPATSAWVINMSQMRPAVLIDGILQPHLVHAHLVGQRIEGREQPGGKHGHKDNSNTSVELFGPTRYREPCCFCVGLGIQNESVA